MSGATIPSGDLVIGIGAQKSGTSSLWALLRQQSWFLPAERKELQYFSFHHDRGPAWYADRFPTAEPGRTRGEVTPDYLHVPEAAHRMRREAPDARLIAILRHPVDRAHSAYLHARRLGDIPRGLSFREALRTEPQRRGRPFAGLFEGGLYARQLARFLGQFPSEQVHVELFEEFTAPDSGAAERALRFAAPEGAPIVLDGVPQRNAFHEVRLPAAARARMVLIRASDRLGRPGIQRLARSVRPAIALRRPATPPEMDSLDRAHLLERYAPENAALSALLGRPLPGWDR